MLAFQPIPREEQESPAMRRKELFLNCWAERNPVTHESSWAVLECVENRMGHLRMSSAKPGSGDCPLVARPLILSDASPSLANHVELAFNRP